MGGKQFRVCTVSVGTQQLGLTYFRTPNQRKSVEPLNHYGIVVDGRTVDSFQSIGQPIRIRTRHDIPTHTVPTAAVHLGWILALSVESVDHRDDNVYAS